jgi:hypothetical protein
MKRGELISIFGMLGHNRKVATALGPLRLADLQACPSEMLDLTNLTVHEFRQLVFPFEAAFQAHMRYWCLDGKLCTVQYT